MEACAVMISKGCLGDGMGGGVVWEKPFVWSDCGQGCGARERGLGNCLGCIADKWEGKVVGGGGDRGWRGGPCGPRWMWVDEELWDWREGVACVPRICEWYAEGRGGRGGLTSIGS